MMGIDLVYVPRIEALIQKGPFLSRFFTEKENEYFEKRQDPKVVAGNFAVKEAFSKALGTAIREFSFKDVEVLREESGKPYIALRGKLEKKQFHKIHCSISHDGDYATAIVILEEENETNTGKNSPVQSET